jgi:zinc transport system substrate-binding protein
LALTGAAAAQGTSGDGRPPAVVATIKPIHSLAAAIMQGVAEPALLLQGTASPHVYALKPSDVRTLNEARLVVLVGDTLETFMGKVLASLPKSVEVARLDQIDGLTLLPVREGGPFEAHTHAGEGGKHKHGHGHSHGRADRGRKAKAAEHDGHIWLDPANAKLIGAYLAQVLSRISPAHAATFEANRRKLDAELDALTAELARETTALKAKPFFVFHDAYQYFEARFGLPAAGSITVNPEVPPGARRLKDIKARLDKGGAVCVFAEPQFDAKLVRSLVEGSKVRAGSLDPNGAALPAGPGAYPTLLRGLVSDLKACLEAQS